MAYAVPNRVFAIAQLTSNVCWATVYAMLKSWRDQKSYDPATAVGAVGAKYLELYRTDQKYEGAIRMVDGEYFQIRHFAK